MVCVLPVRRCLCRCQIRQDKTSVLDCVAALSATVSSETKRPFYRRLDAAATKLQLVGWMTELEDNRRKCIQLTGKWSHVLRTVADDVAVLRR